MANAARGAAQMLAATAIAMASRFAVRGSLARFIVACIVVVLRTRPCRERIEDERRWSVLTETCYSFLDRRARCNFRAHDYEHDVRAARDVLRLGGDEHRRCVDEKQA